MRERNLTPEQIDRIEQIKEEWRNELDKLQEEKLGLRTLSQASNHARRELEKKYFPRIKAIYEENISN